MEWSSDICQVAPLSRGLFRETNINREEIWLDRLATWKPPQLEVEFYVRGREIVHTVFSSPLK